MHTKMYQKLQKSKNKDKFLKVTREKKISYLKGKGDLVAVDFSKEVIAAGNGVCFKPGEKETHDL